MKKDTGSQMGKALAEILAFIVFAGIIKIMNWATGEHKNDKATLRS